MTINNMLHTMNSLLKAGSGVSVQRPATAAQSILAVRRAATTTSGMIAARSPASIPSGRGEPERRAYWENRDTQITADIPSEAVLQSANWGTGVLK